MHPPGRDPPIPAAAVADKAESEGGAGRRMREWEQTTWVYAAQVAGFACMMAGAAVGKQVGPWLQSVPGMWHPRPMRSLPFEWELAVNLPFFVIALGAPGWLLMVAVHRRWPWWTAAALPGAGCVPAGLALAAGPNMNPLALAVMIWHAWLFAAPAGALLLWLRDRREAVRVGGPGDD